MAVSKTLPLKIFMALSFGAVIFLKPQTYIILTLPPGEPPIALRSAAWGYWQGLRLLHAGDGGGQSIPLRNYDYYKIRMWLEGIEAANPSSEIAPFLGAYYFSYSPIIAHKKIIGEYVENFVRRHHTINHKQWIFIADYLRKFSEQVL